MDGPNRRKSSFVEEPIQKILVGVAGGSAAGKTTLCENIYRQMAFDRNFKVEIISLDSFYKPIDKTKVDVTSYNFDHPNAIDFDLAYQVLNALITSNSPVAVPQYCFINHNRKEEVTMVGPANIIFFEGLMTFRDQRIRDLMTYKIFINCDDDIRLCRRLKRDTTERGRSVISVLDQYNKFVKNAFRDFILPTIVYADIIIPGFRNNRVSVDFIVQHIKNMAMRITFKERAIKTRTFIFGESQLYDLDYSSNYEQKVGLENQSFLVFPTSNEHRRELQFFLNSLLSQIFSVQYFQEVYINQFIKVLRHLFQQLISFKNFDPSKMEVLPVYHLQDVLRMPEDKYTIKVLFFPMAEVGESKVILTTLKQHLETRPNTTFIILNTFCDVSVPNMIYRFGLSNVIMVNLFVIANDRRFREAMSNNISAKTEGLDWLIHNHILAEETVDVLATHFKLFRRSDVQLAKSRYQFFLQSQEKKQVARKIDQEEEKVGNMRQFNVFSQQQQNLCGFHALSTVLCLEAGKDILDRDIFIRNYSQLAWCLGRVDYQPLERHNVAVILSSKLFESIKNIGVLFFSFKYIQNSEDQNEQLQRLFDNLRAEKYPYIYVLLGVVDHYLVAKVTKKAISLFDSQNYSLRDVMNGTHNQIDPNSQLKGAELKHLNDRKQNLKEALEIINELLQGKKVTGVLVEKRIDEIAGSFNKISGHEEGVKAWLQNEYPKEVIKSDLFNVMRGYKVEVNAQHRAQLHQFLTHPAIRQLFPDEESHLF